MSDYKNATCFYTEGTPQRLRLERVEGSWVPSYAMNSSMIQDAVLVVADDGELLKAKPAPLPGETRHCPVSEVDVERVPVKSSKIVDEVVCALSFETDEALDSLSVVEARVTALDEKVDALIDKLKQLGLLKL